MALETNRIGRALVQLRTAALVFAVGAAPLLGSITTNADTPRAAEYLPDGLAIVFTLRDGDEQVQRFRTLLAARNFNESPVYAAIEANPGMMQARIGLLGVAAAAGVDPWSAVGSVFGRETTIGLIPRDNDDARVIAASVARDPDQLDKLLKQVYMVAGLMRGGEPDPDHIVNIEGVRVWKLDDGFLHCRVDDALIVSNDEELLESALKARAAGEGRLIDAPAFGDSDSSVAADSVAWSFADLDLIREIAGEDAELPALMPNPLAGFLFGGWWHTIRHADSAYAWTTAHDGELLVDLVVNSDVALPETHLALIPDDLKMPNWSASTLPRYLGDVTVPRHWEALFADREALLTLPAASDVVNFSNTLSTLMGQLDFMDDFLARVTGPTRAILVRQNFEGRPYNPTPKIPAFALVAPMSVEPGSRIERQIYSAGLSSLSVISLDAAQNNRPALAIDMSMHEGRKIVYAAYEAVGDEDEEGDEGMMGMTAPATVGIEYNFEPALAVVNRQVVITTSLDLMRDVIDAAQSAPPAEAFEPVDSLVINGGEVIEILRDNLDELVMNRMLEEDQSKADAQRDLEAFLSLLGEIDSIELTSRGSSNEYSGRLRVNLTGTE